MVQLGLVLLAARINLTRRKILRAWPAEQERSSDVTLWRWLERAVARGLVAREGEGRRADPFLYWLPEQEAVWRNDPAWIEEERRRETRRFIEDFGRARQGIQGPE